MPLLYSISHFQAGTAWMVTLTIPQTDYTVAIGKITPSAPAQGCRSELNVIGDINADGRIDSKCSMDRDGEDYDRFQNGEVVFAGPSSETGGTVTVVNISQRALDGDSSANPQIALAFSAH